jgi:hypothetical protein
VREFNDLHLVLASYNAGEGNVRRWMAEREGLPHDVFIDDIPFPETQNYVKKILGTAEDYRRLYGPGAGASADDQLPEARPASAVSVGRQPAAPKAAKKPAATKSSRKRRHTT